MRATLNRFWLLPLFLALSVFDFSTPLARAQGTAFTYQGRLNDGGNPAHGSYDFHFRLASDPLANNYVSNNIFTNGVTVTNGLLTVALDFGTGIFTGSNYWLEVDVCTNGAGSYVVLTPLQPVTPTPYAIMANSASNLLGSLPAAQLNGSLANANLPSSPTFSGTVAASSFSGSGAGLTGVNAASLGGLTATNFWQVGGNFISTGQFIGSLNNQPVEFRVNNTRVLRLEPAVGGQGAPNVIEGSPYNYVVPGVAGATVGGGGATNYFDGPHTNSVTGDFGTVSGGDGNIAYFNCTVGGGFANAAIGFSFSDQGAATVGGGAVNTASGDFSTISGGYNNTASGFAFGDAAVGGGANNVASADFSTVSGGEQGLASGLDSAVGGGNGNQATNNGATVPGGVGNLAGGQFSFAAGRRAQAINHGTFVWADSQNADFSSTTTNEFSIRAQSGIRIQADKGIHLNNADEPMIVRDWDIFSTNASASKVGIGRWGVFQEFQHLTLGIPDNVTAWFQVAKYSTNGTYTTLMQVDQSGVVSPTGGLRINDKPIYLRSGSDTNHGLAYNGNTITNFGSGNVQVDGPVLWGFAGGALGVMTSSAHPVLVWSNNVVAVTGSVYANGVQLTSDRNAKENFIPLDTKSVLEKVASLPLSEWNYKNENSNQKHLGPMAQDFHAAFGLDGTDDKHISVIDEGGVALAAIQGLNQKLSEKDAEIQKLESQNDSLSKRLAALEATVRTMAR